MKNLFFKLFPLCFFGYAIFGILATSKLAYLFNDDYNKAGFKLKSNSFGPSIISYKQTKKVLELSKHRLTLKKATESILLFKIAYGFLFAFGFVFVLSFFLDV